MEAFFASRMAELLVPLSHHIFRSKRRPFVACKLYGFSLAWWIYRTPSCLSHNLLEMNMNHRTHWKNNSQLKYKVALWMFNVLFILGFFVINFYYLLLSRTFFWRSGLWWLKKKIQPEKLTWINADLPPRWTSISNADNQPTPY